MNELRGKIYRKPLGKKLRIWRQRRKMSQLEVSQFLGYSSPQFVSNWERGLASPPLSVLVKLTRLYRVSSRTAVNFFVSLEREFLLSMMSDLRDGHEKESVLIAMRENESKESA